MNYTLLTDKYEYDMANGYILNSKNDPYTCFDVFFRKVPNNGGYAIMAGLSKVIEYIKNMRFTADDIEYLRKYGYSEEFLNELKNYKFSGTIRAIPDGTPVFPNEPLLTVIAKTTDAQIIETAILCILNGSMEHATAARRIIEATPKNVPVMEFGSRRAVHLEDALNSSILSIMAGCAGTSNVLAAKQMGMKALGTMAHSWVETFDSEFDAFKAFVNIYPNNATLLVDTYDTLSSGVPNAIKTFKYMQENNMPTDHIGIRIDSGDLAYLSKESRRMLNEAGFPQAKICLSNGLNAETIETLIHQGAYFDSLGVGDNISKPEGRMGCVYKEVQIGNIPKIKLSNDPIKIINPYLKKLYRIYDNKTGYALADVMAKENEFINREDLLIVSPSDLLKRKVVSDYNVIELQKTIFESGELVYEDPTLLEKREYCEEQMQKLYPEVRRTILPHEYHVSATEEYAIDRQELIKSVRKRVYHE